MINWLKKLLFKNKDITPTNKENQAHGYWEQYHDNGQLWYKGNWDNGLAHGYFESYYTNGELKYKGNYNNGKRHGYFEDYYDKRIEFYI